MKKCMDIENVGSVQRVYCRGVELVSVPGPLQAYLI